MPSKLHMGDFIFEIWLHILIYFPWVKNKHEKGYDQDTGSPVIASAEYTHSILTKIHELFL